MLVPKKRQDLVPQLYSVTVYTDIIYEVLAGTISREHEAVHLYINSYKKTLNILM